MAATPSSDTPNATPARDPRPTAAVVVIGDEVLAGKVVEQNVGFLVTRFRALGVRLARVVMVPDDLDDIGQTVRAMSERFDHVCTTGGVGPTHDDVTIAAIARGFDVPVVEDEALLAQMTTWLDREPDAGHRRMARAPEGSELVRAEGMRWPTIRFRNVWIFPGVPSLLKLKFTALESHFQGMPVHAGALALVSDEASLCEALDAVVASHPTVDIGSYPSLEGGRWSLRLTVESLDPDAAARALDALAALCREAGRPPTSIEPVARAR